ncbi:hypothetical protein ABEB36_007425 [Hypothenemus hampei]|uniref:Bardet-Biedl syndrome 4 n=1 Tax=Hypothenemus hampei TaxID=57062 RepID=A0ABD1EX13_HYPHA
MLLNGRENLHSASVSGKTLKKETAKCLEPAPMEKFNWLIHLQHVRGEIGACKELIKEEIARNQGKHEYVYFKQGIIAKEEGNLQEALEIFQKCLKLNLNNHRILKEVAKCLYEMKRFRLALNAFLETEQLMKSPDWQLCYFIGKYQRVFKSNTSKLFSAETYMKLGNLEKAKEYANKSVKLGKQEESYLLLIKNMTLEKDFRSAIAVANAGVESCPESVKLLTEAGLLFLKTGQSQYAFERFSQALALDQTCSRALLGIGCITHRHEEYDVALSKYKIAVLYDPESLALWNNIGMCFYSKQKYIAAISCLKRSLWLAPLNWKILFNLALVHLATNQPASGFNFACAAVNLRPDLGDCFALLAYTLFELNDLENALRALKQAHSLIAADAFVIANAGLLLHLQGRNEESKEFLLKFKTLSEQGEITVTNEMTNLVENISKFYSDNLVKRPDVTSNTELAEDEV